MISNNLFKAQKYALQRFRCYSTGPKVYNFIDIKDIVQNPSKHHDKVLVDVREPEELKLYSMPSAINIPLNSSPEALTLSDRQFEDKFEFAKPLQDKELVFFCAKGIRAAKAQDIASKVGYNKTAVYPGSITDWLLRGGDKCR